jgi:hypothetical protein
MRLVSASLVTVALAVGLMAAFFSVAVAQSEPAEAREIAGLSFGASAYDMLLVQAGRGVTFFVKTTLEERLGRQLPEDEFRRLTEIVTRVMKQTIPQSGHENALAAVLARHFSPQELKELAAFYRTPLGRKLESRAAFERAVNVRRPELLERFRTEFAREFPVLNQELERK